MINLKKIIKEELLKLGDKKIISECSPPQPGDSKYSIAGGPMHPMAKPEILNAYMEFKTQIENEGYKIEGNFLNGEIINLTDPSDNRVHWLDKNGKRQVAEIAYLHHKIKSIE